MSINESQDSHLVRIREIAEKYYPKRLYPIENKEAYTAAPEYQRLYEFKFYQLSTTIKAWMNFIIVIRQNEQLQKYIIKDISDPRTENCFHVTFYLKGQDPKRYSVAGLLVSYILPYFTMYTTNYSVGDDFTSITSFELNDIRNGGFDYGFLEQLIQENIGSEYINLQGSILQETIPNIALFHTQIDRTKVAQFLYSDISIK